MTSPKIFDKFWLVFRYAMPMQMHSNSRDGYNRICRALINLVPYLSSRNVRTPRIAHTTPSASDQMRWGNQGSFVKGPCVDEDIYYLLQKYFNAENIKLFVNNHFLDPSSVVHSKRRAVQNSELCTASARTAVAHFFSPCVWYQASVDIQSPVSEDVIRPAL